MCVRKSTARLQSVWKQVNLLGLSYFFFYRLPAELYHDNDEYVFSQILHVCQIQVGLWKRMHVIFCGFGGALNCYQNNRLHHKLALDWTLQIISSRRALIELGH